MSTHEDRPMTGHRNLRELDSIPRCTSAIRVGNFASIPMVLRCEREDGHPGIHEANRGQAFRAYQWPNLTAETVRGAMAQGVTVNHHSLSAELAKLERTDPAVREAAERLDAVFDSILARGDVSRARFRKSTPDRPCEVKP